MDIDPLIRLLFSRIGNPPIDSATDFSSQSSFGRCPECSGYGKVIAPDQNKMIDYDKSLRDYAVKFKPLSPSGDRKSTRLNSSHVAISYAVFCLKKKTSKNTYHQSLL